LNLNNGNDGTEVEQNLSSSSSSSSSHPILSCFGNLTRRNKEIGLQDSSDFFNLKMLKEKDRAAKLEALVKEVQNDLAKPSKSYTQLFIERAQEVDFSMDFWILVKR
jgi:hypothetical protein